MKEALEEHKKIVEAISERKAAQARQLAQQHIENAENSMLEAIKDKDFSDVE